MSFRSKFGSSAEIKRGRRPLRLELLESRDLLAAFRFAMIGDFGNANPPADWVADTVKSWDPAFIVTVGDNLQHFSVGDDYDLAVGKNWHEFVNNYQGIHGEGSPTPRFFPALGNHDWPALGNFLDFFTLPGNERYFDFTWESVHFFIVNSNQDEPDGATADSIQAEWLRDALAASTADFQIVSLHHPPYSSGLRYGNDANMQWPFAEWGADAVLSGHESVYERVEVDGIPYFTIGLGGGETPYFFGETIPESRFRFRDSYGAMQVTVDGAETRFEFYTAAIGDAFPSVLVDRFSIFSTDAAVVGRQLFYNNSAFDGFDAAATVADDAAVATDKQPILPGGAASTASYSTFAAGLTGVMIDVRDLANPALVDAYDFEFRMGRTADPTGWETAPPPMEILVREGAGVNGADRVTLVWADDAIRDTWLQIVLKATATTGLATDDVHYWGHAAADTGDEPIDGEVVADFADAWRVANASAAGVAIDSPFDLNRDGSVDDADVQIVLASVSGPMGDLNRDGVVGIADLAILHQRLGAADATALMGDLTYDGQVTLADVAVLALAYGDVATDQMRSRRLPLFDAIGQTEASSPAANAAVSFLAASDSVTQSVRSEVRRLEAAGVDSAITSTIRRTTSRDSRTFDGDVRRLRGVRSAMIAGTAQAQIREDRRVRRPEGRVREAIEKRIVADAAAVDTFLPEKSRL